MTQISEKMQAFWADDPAPHEMGVELIAALEGKSELRLALQRKHLNGHKIAHGGVVHLLADCAAGFAANSWGDPAVTQTNSITFISAAKEGEVLTAKGAFLARSGRSAMFDVMVTAQDGRTVAVLRAQMRYIPAKS